MASARTVTLLGVASPNVVKVAIMLEEVGLTYELKYVEVFKGEQFNPQFLALNPLGKVPVLLDPALGRPLAESGAILLWLAEDSGRFLPRDGADRYEVIQWLMVQMSALGPMLGQFTHFRLLPPGSEPYSYGRYGALAERLYRLLDERLTTREWIAGREYSIADIATFPWAEYLERHGFAWGDFPALSRWRHAIEERSAVRSAKARIHEAFAAPTAQTLRNATAADLDRFFGRTEQVPARDYSAVTRLK